MNQKPARDDPARDQFLDQSLKTLLAAHGYQRVLEHLVLVSKQAVRTEPGEVWRPSAGYLMTLSPEEREPFLEAAVTDALPLYKADLARPEAERVLTADLETGDFHDYDHDYDEAEAHG